MLADISDLYRWAALATVVITLTWYITYCFTKRQSPSQASHANTTPLDALLHKLIQHSYVHGFEMAEEIRGAHKAGLAADDTAQQIRDAFAAQSSRIEELERMLGRS